MNTRIIILCFSALLSAACFSGADSGLLKSREGFKTNIVTPPKNTEPFPAPPPELLSIVEYDTALGKMSAYLTHPPELNKRANKKTNKQYPAIIWITGGFPAGGAGSSVWESRPSDNDQSAKNYWQHNVITMYPSFRGTFGNPGQQEGFYGEVDDVLSALAYLRTLEYVDPHQIYLGGHSTGGTLALLVAAATDKFNAIISFGPVTDPANYGSGNQLHDGQDPKEKYYRAPINFLKYITSPTYVIEGKAKGNYESFQKLKAADTNNNVTFIPIEGGDHFDALFPVNRLIASNIASGSETIVSVRSAQAAYDDIASAERELDDLKVLTALRKSGRSLTSEIEGHYYLASMDEQVLAGIIPMLKELGFSSKPIEKKISSDGAEYYLLVAMATFTPLDLNLTFKYSASIHGLADNESVYYQGWHYY